MRTLLETSLILLRKMLSVVTGCRLVSMVMGVMGLCNLLINSFSFPFNCQVGEYVFWEMYTHVVLLLLIYLCL